MAISNPRKFQAIGLCLSLAQESLIYNSRSDRKRGLRKISKIQFHFNLLSFQAPFKRWINNKLKVILVIFTPYFLSYSIVLYYTQFNETFWWDHHESNPSEKPWISNGKIEQWLMSSGKPRAAGSTHVFLVCQTDVVNKQHFSPPNWNNLLSETSLGKLYWQLQTPRCQGKTFRGCWGSL